MKNIIGAEAAKLAGLQIDHLQKLRDGQRTIDQFEWYLNLPNAEIASLAGPPKPAKNLNLKKLLIWLKKNELDSKLPGGLMGQITDQEKFYQKFFGPDFRIDRKKISVDPARLTAIKVGLEVGCLNYALIKMVPEYLSGAETQMTEAEFLFERILKPLKSDGFKIWAETGTGRWTNLTLRELLQRSNPVEPDEFDAESFRKDWAAEEMRIIVKRGLVPTVQAGAVDLIFTNNAEDIPRNQKTVNKDGEVVELGDHSYISAITKKVRVISHAEGIILAGQLFAKNKSWLAPGTWEWRRDVVAHVGVNPQCSVADASSGGDGLVLYSDGAGWSCGSSRGRLAL